MRRACRRRWSPTFIVRTRRAGGWEARAHSFSHFVRGETLAPLLSVERRATSISRVVSPFRSRHPPLISERALSPLATNHHLCLTRRTRTRFVDLFLHQSSKITCGNRLSSDRIHSHTALVINDETNKQINASQVSSSNISNKRTECVCVCVEFFLLAPGVVGTTCTCALSVLSVDTLRLRSRCVYY